MHLSETNHCCTMACHTITFFLGAHCLGISIGTHVPMQVDEMKKLSAKATSELKEFRAAKNSWSWTLKPPWGGNANLTHTHPAGLETPQTFQSNLFDNPLGACFGQQFLWLKHHWQQNTLNFVGEIKETCENLWWAYLLSTTCSTFVFLFGVRASWDGLLAP